MFNQQKADAVCELLADGKSLRAACDDLGLKRTTILDWARDVAAFSDQYARARETGYKLLADEILEISDDSTGDTFTDNDGNIRTDAERVARSRLRVDSRKWMLSKMLPKIYGEKTETVLSGSMEIRQPMDQIRAELAEMLKKAVMPK